MSGDTKRVLEVNQIDNLQGSTQRVKQETTLNNLRGVTQRVYVVGGGGSTPVIDELNVTPSTSAQTITAPEGVDGYSPVNVSAVDNTIDANIVAGNIKKDVQILGVTGSYEGQTPTGTMYIISNGTYNVADKAIANVQVPSAARASVGLMVNNGRFYYSAPIDLTGIQSISSGIRFNKEASGNSDFIYSTGEAFTNSESLTTISEVYAFTYTFNGCTGITSVSLPNLTTVNGLQVFYFTFDGCTGITSVDLHSLSSVSGTECCRGMFNGCTGLTSVDLSSLTTISGNYGCAYMFSYSNLTSIYLPKISDTDYVSRVNTMSSAFFNCTNLTVADLRNLEYCGNYGILDSLFNGVPNLTVLNLNSLKHIGMEGARGLVFLSGSTSSTLTDLYFPMLTTFGTNPFYTNAFAGREGLTIHFRKDAQATVEALQNYATLWGAGTGSSVVFDLAGTLTGADSNSYARSEKDSVYASETAGAAKTATAWSYNNTTYYTSGGNEPQVGDTIYSDSACTTAVTTISSIA